MKRVLLARLIAGVIALAGVGLALAQAPPPSCPVEYYTHRCHPHHNKDKYCVPEIDTKKKKTNVYCFKEVDYCYPKCTCGCGWLSKLFLCLFPKEDCDCHGCAKCGCVRTRRVMLKKTITCEQPIVKCRVEYLPCACPPFDPTRKPGEVEKNGAAAPTTGGGGGSGGGASKEGTRPKASEGRQGGAGTSGSGGPVQFNGVEVLPPPRRKWVDKPMTP